MEIREATEADAPTIRSVARFSMEASYSLSPGAIESAVEKWYDDDALADKFGDEETVILVAETDDGVVGFSDNQLVADYGEILWLHVNPMFRGEGIGEDLFEATRDELSRRGAEYLRGRVLNDNPDGKAFYEEHGLELVDDEKVDIDGTQHIENIYADEAPAEVTTVSEDGRALFIDRSDPQRGSDEAIYPVYSDEEMAKMYGYYCGECGSLIVSMDSMGRMECDECGNVHKPRRWDAAYL